MEETLSCMGKRILLGKKKKSINCFVPSQESGFILRGSSVCQLDLKKCLKLPTASLSFLDLIKLTQIKAPWINRYMQNNTVKSKFFCHNEKNGSQREHETKHELGEKVIMEITENI